MTVTIPSPEGPQDVQSENEESVRVTIRIRPLNQQEQNHKTNKKSRRRAVPFSISSLSSVSSKKKKKKNANDSDDDDGGSLANDAAYGWDYAATDNTIALKQDLENQKQQQPLSFAFDHIMREEHSTRHVYDTAVRPIVKGITQGKHGTVFLYGPTSTGKTYTMQGAGIDLSLSLSNEEAQNKDWGVLQWAALDLFQYADKNNSSSNKEQTTKTSTIIQVSYIEIYNEQVRDLLVGLDENDLNDRDDEDDGQSHSTASTPTSHPGTTTTPPPKSFGSGSPTTSNGTHDAASSLVIRETSRGQIQLVGSKVLKVSSLRSLLQALQYGNHNRSVAATARNGVSSRSHAIVQLTVVTVTQAPRKGNNDVTQGRRKRLATLNLVDLAGSENSTSAKTSNQLKREGGKINQSLLSLSQVIFALSLPKDKRPPFINYRDSKLTRILQPHLSGGNALLSIICCISPSRLCVEETKSTLRFATRAKLVSTRAVVNEEAEGGAASLHVKRILALQAELDSTRKALQEMERRSQEAEENSKTATQEMLKLKTIVMGSLDEKQSNVDRVASPARAIFSGQIGREMKLPSILPPRSPMKSPAAQNSPSLLSPKSIATTTTASSSPASSNGALGGGPCKQPKKKRRKTAMSPTTSVLRGYLPPASDVPTIFESDGEVSMEAYDPSCFDEHLLMNRSRLAESFARVTPRSLDTRRKLLPQFQASENNSKTNNKDSSCSSTTATLPSEVLVMNRAAPPPHTAAAATTPGSQHGSSPPSAGPMSVISWDPNRRYLQTTDQLSQSYMLDMEQRAKFLEDRLEVTEDLVERLKMDLYGARQCIHLLIHKNSKLASRLEKYYNRAKSLQEEQPWKEKEAYMFQQYLLLKYVLYFSLVAFLFRWHEIFLGLCFFVWLTVEVYTGS